MNGTQIVAILKAARERVARGWLQNQASNPSGTRVCAAQAITMAVVEQNNLGLYFESTPENVEAVNSQTMAVGQQLLVAAHELTQIEWAGIPMWNDFPDRTQNEVVETFDHAIKLAERDSELVGVPV